MLVSDSTILLTGCYAAQIDLVQGMMDCLYAECKPCITDCVLAELEKLGQKYRVALKVAKVRSGKSQRNIRSLHFTVAVMIPVTCTNTDIFEVLHVSCQAEHAASHAPASINYNVASVS